MANDEHVSLRLGKETTVTMIFEGPVTQHAIARLLAHLELMKDDYPTPEQERVAALERSGTEWTKTKTG